MAKRFVLPANGSILKNLLTVHVLRNNISNSCFDSYEGDYLKTKKSEHEFTRIIRITHKFMGTYLLEEEVMKSRKL